MNVKPISILCITLGGERQQRIQELFASTTFKITFIDGIPQRQLRSKKGLLAALHTINILKVDNEHLQQDIDILEEECWLAMRNLNRDRGVLACTFAHLRAMSICTQDDSDIDLIIEDNICGSILSGISAERIRAVLSETPNADLIYFAYGGRSNEIQEWQENQKDANDELNKAGEEIMKSSSVKKWPTKILLEKNNDDDNTMKESKKKEQTDQTEGKEANILWGLMAYKPSKTAYNAIMDEIRMDCPGSLAWQPKRAKNQKAKPIDKIVPKYCLKRNLSIVVAKHPCFFRAPIKSTIHPKLDAQFMETTETQLMLSGLTWQDIDLTKEEKETVKETERRRNMTESEKKIEDDDNKDGKTKRTWEGWTGKQQEKKERQIPTAAIEVVCSVCHICFPSKNKLFKHLKSGECK